MRLHIFIFIFLITILSFCINVFAFETTTTTTIIPTTTTTTTVLTNATTTTTVLLTTTTTTTVLTNATTTTTIIPTTTTSFPFPILTTTPPQTIPQPKLKKILSLLDDLKNKFQKLSTISQAIANFYFERGIMAKGNCWREVSMMFEATILKIDNIKAELEVPLVNIGEIRYMIKELRRDVNKIADKIFQCSTIGTTTTVVSTSTTTTTYPLTSTTTTTLIPTSTTTIIVSTNVILSLDTATMCNSNNFYFYVRNDGTSPSGRVTINATDPTSRNALLGSCEIDNIPPGGMSGITCARVSDEPAGSYNVTLSTSSTVVHSLTYCPIPS